MAGYELICFECKKVIERFDDGEKKFASVCTECFNRNYEILARVNRAKVGEVDDQQADKRSE